VNYAVVANMNVMINRHIGVDAAFRAQATVLTDKNTGSYNGVAAHDGTRLNNDMGSNRSRRMNLGIG
jgi:hypothetical protein